MIFTTSGTVGWLECSGELWRGRFTTTQLSCLSRLLELLVLEWDKLTGAEPPLPWLLPGLTAAGVVTPSSMYLDSWASSCLRRVWTSLVSSWRTNRKWIQHHDLRLNIKWELKSVHWVKNKKIDKIMKSIIFSHPTIYYI